MLGSDPRFSPSAPARLVGNGWVHESKLDGELVVVTDDGQADFELPSIRINDWKPQPDRLRVIVCVASRVGELAGRLG